MSSGYSSGPTRNVPMRYDEAEETFSRARDPDAGKPLPGKEVRLWQRGNDYYVSYLDSPVVYIHQDGTYTLDHCGYATRMTIQRMEEYAPVQLAKVGKTKYKRKGYYEDAWLGADNLELSFPCGIMRHEKRQSLFYQVFPEEFRRTCYLEFPRQKLHVDAEGRPVLDSLLSEIAPPEWKYKLVKLLQPWEPIQRIPGQITPVISKWHSAAYAKKWPTGSDRPGQVRMTSDTGGLVAQPVLVRREWNGNRPVASVWVYFGRRREPKLYRWVIPDFGFAGQSTRLELAVNAVDRKLRWLQYSSAPPLLTDVLGNLREQLETTQQIEPSQLALPFDFTPLLSRQVLRAHWMQPWDTREFLRNYPMPASMPDSRSVPRAPMTGAKPWPGSGDVRVWFELVDGTAVGILHDKKTNKDVVLVHSLTAQQRTQWSTPGVLAAGLLGAALAWFTGGIR